jgi:hypothetical protein
MVLLLRNPQAELKDYFSRCKSDADDPDDWYCVPLLQWLSSTIAGDLPKKPMCVSCDREFDAGTLPSCFLLVAPTSLDRPAAVGITGVCRRCERKSDAVLLRCGCQVWGLTDPRTIAQAGTA